MHQTFELERGGSFCLSKAGLAEGTNAATIQIAAPNGAGVDYCINGLMYHKADANNIAMNALAVQAVSTKCLYAVQLDAAGAVSLVKGDEELTADITAGNRVLHWPAPVEDRCVLGYILIETDDSNTFTSGTTDLSATGITATFIDVLAAPAAPRTS